ncbi:LOW QUALITY PROTEIN: cilia- and flagella-associated protein 337-like [Amphiura filiformis]|uniref:LOW QUALITY PROTEIN: cilia- and flagella-associated protein 337-like n=1 Tax=Amphiura filiformis TaxID=82378 RepID=UPI003B2153CE
MERRNIEDVTSRFEDHIKLRHLKELMRMFDIHEPSKDMPPDGFYTPGRVVKREAGNVTLKEFKDMVQSMLKTDAWDTQMESLFAKVDTSADGMVDWNEFCTYMLLHYKESDAMKRKQAMPFTGQPKIRHVGPNKQEAVYCVISVEFFGSKYHVTMTKEGVLCIFDTNLHLERSFEIKSEKDEPRSSKRRFKTWYTDIAFLGNIGKVVICSTGRDLRFWDISTGCFVEEFHLYALNDVPMCLSYWYDKKNPSQDSLLLVGDDMGNIHLWYFLKPYDKLFETPFSNKEGVQKIWAQDLHLHQRLVRHVVIPNIHGEMVRKVQYVPETDAILSSSGSYKTSLVHLDISGKRKTYVYKLSKGVECFDYSRDLNVLVTGSLDHTVRVWNPYLEDKPVAFLIGHMMAVVAVVLNVDYAHVYSFSKDGYIKVWDLRDYTCIQTVLVRFPPLTNAHSPEYGPVCMYAQSNRALIACCGDYIATLRLGRIENNNRDMPITHNAQLCGAMYNSNFRQIVTSGDDSTVTIWDLDSGAKSFSIEDAHGTEEITCMACSTTGRKLMTGARNGTVKVWNFQNGHNIFQCESTAEAEITGLVSLGKKKGFLSVGWSRMITFYDDSDSDTSFIKADNEWKGGQVHMDDILSVDIVRPNLLVTASFDGEIIVWSAETETIFVRLRKAQPMQITQRLKEAMSNPGSATSNVRQRSKSFLTANESQHGVKRGIFKNNSRPNSRHVQKHKHPEGFPQAPVDKVLFLQSRLSKGLNESAVLVSSEAGYLHFWSLHGRDHHKGSFYASDSLDEEESVLALATDKENTILISGDTMGHLHVWDIQDYYSNTNEQIPHLRPPLRHQWKAHDLAVVSIEFIYQTFGLFVLTASTDWTARLWTLEGHFVGTFGQQQQWNLRNPETYQHPRTPWSYLDDRKHAIVKTNQHFYDLESDDDNESKESDAEGDTESKNTSRKMDKDNTKVQNHLNQENQQTTKWTIVNNNTSYEVSGVTKSQSGDNPTIDAIESGSDQHDLTQEAVTIATEVQKNSLPSITPKVQKQKNLETTINKNNLDEFEKISYGRSDSCSSSRSGGSEEELRARSASIGSEIGWSEDREFEEAKLLRQASRHTLLGVQVEQGLAKITQSRQQRRQRFGDVDAKSTVRFGKTCSPFQALSLLQTDKVTFPSDLPMTPGMLKRGLTCTTEKDLRNLTLSPLPFGEVKVEKVTKPEPLPAIGTNHQQPTPR